MRAKRIAFLIFAASILLFVQAKTRASAGDLCYQVNVTGNCGCTFTGCVCDQWVDCSESYPDFCSDLDDLCRAKTDMGTMWCDPGGPTSNCQGSCWEYPPQEGQCDEYWMLSLCDCDHYHTVD